MTAEPIFEPEHDPHDLIHLGGETAVVVPVAEYRRLRALERIATAEELEDAEDAAAVEEWQARKAAGTAIYVGAEEARQRLGLPR